MSTNVKIRGPTDTAGRCALESITGPTGQHANAAGSCHHVEPAAQSQPLTLHLKENHDDETETNQSETKTNDDVHRVSSKHALPALSSAQDEGQPTASDALPCKYIPGHTSRRDFDRGKS